MKRLAISFSGGSTSAVMTKLLWDQRTEWGQIEITFANTGCEHPATLDFVRDCADHWGWPVVWLEAVVGPKGVGIRHKVVDFQTASRNGEPFEAVIGKYGIFNRHNISCTDRLKTEVMYDYLRSVGYRGGKYKDYDTAIGIRADEMDRVSVRAKEKRFVYPLVDAGYTKRDVALEIKKWGFDLQIPHDAFGNCVWCWKKSLRKLMTVAREDPTAFDFPARMENQYANVRTDRKITRSDGRTVFFREERSAEDILRLAAETDFEPYRDDPWQHGKETYGPLFDPYLDTGSACGDSCEIGADI